MKFIKHLIKNCLITFAALLVIYFIVMAILSTYDNFHTVVPGKVYRSAQLSAKQFNQYIHKYQIKSIINLRGAHNHAPWYAHELAISGKDGIKHYDLHLDAMNTNSKVHMLQLIQLLKSSPKPVLIHCQHGSDRTGLASAFAIILFTHQPLSKAIHQTSSDFLAVDPRSTGKVEMALYKQWLMSNNRQNSAKNLQLWLAESSH